MRICALNGSLRGASGVTNRLLEAVGEGAASAGGTWDQVDLARMRIERCRACNYCQRERTHRCVYSDRDDVERVFARMAAAELLVYATPVYVFGMSSLLKSLLERLYSRAPVAGALLTESGLFFHATDRSLTAKPYATLVVADNMENATVRNTRDYFRTFGQFLDARHIGHLERRSAAAWTAALQGQDATARRRAEEVLEACRRAGVELVSAGVVSRGTARRAAVPFVTIPRLVRIARCIPPLRPKLAAQVQRRAGVMIDPR